MCSSISNIRIITLALLHPLFMIDSGSIVIAQNTMVTFVMRNQLICQ